MGTGAVSILLHNFPYPARWLYWLSITVFCIEILLFIILTLIFALRFTLYPAQWATVLSHPTQSLFLAAWPMGLAQIIFLLIYVCAPLWGPWVVYLAWGLWIFDAAVSVAIILLVPFLHMKVKNHRQLASFTALELFPFLAAMVASGTGAVVSTALLNSQLALGTVLASYILMGISLPMSFIATTIYTQRLLLHKLPPRAVIVSVFMPVGPPCMGGIAAIVLGETARHVFPKTEVIHPLAGEVFYCLGLLWALTLWGFACVWLGFAVFTVGYLRRFEFNLGWWAFTFPLALFASISIKIGEVLPSRFFRVVGTIVAVIVFVLWILVSGMTIRGAISGKLFEAPLLPATTGKNEIRKNDIELAEDTTKDD